MLLSDGDQQFLCTCLDRIADNDYYLDCLSRDERRRLAVLIDRICAELDVPGSVYGRG